MSSLFTIKVEFADSEQGVDTFRVDDWEIHDQGLMMKTYDKPERLWFIPMHSIHRVDIIKPLED